MKKMRETCPYVPLAPMFKMKKENMHFFRGSDLVSEKKDSLVLIKCIKRIGSMENA